MREIKFRCFENDLGMFNIESSSDYTLEFGNEKPILHIHCSDGPMDFIASDFELMQFTGLLDKNGAEVYEGDIVEYISIQNNKFIGEVSWNPFNSMAGFQTDNPHINIFKERQTEVIGNIHESPELLENK